VKKMMLEGIDPAHLSEALLAEGIALRNERQIGKPYIFC
jgi:hypothetical protein